MEETRCVYVLEFDDGHVKIGYSENPESRIATLEKENTAKLLQHWISTPIESAFQVEQATHDYFSDFRKHGEYFTARFGDAVEKVLELIEQRIGEESQLYPEDGIGVYNFIRLGFGKELGPYGFALYSTIRGHVEGNPPRTPLSNKELQRLTGISDAQISRTTKLLIASGYIHKERMFRATVYFVNELNTLQRTNSMQ